MNFFYKNSIYILDNIPPSIKIKCQNNNNLAIFLFIKLLILNTFKIFGNLSKNLILLIILSLNIMDNTEKNDDKHKPPMIILNTQTILSGVRVSKNSI